MEFVKSLNRQIGLLTAVFPDCLRRQNLREQQPIPAYEASRKERSDVE